MNDRWGRGNGQLYVNVDQNPNTNLQGQIGTFGVYQQNYGGIGIENYQNREFQQGDANFGREYYQNGEFQHGNGGFGIENYQNREFQHGNGNFGREYYQNSEFQHGNGYYGREYYQNCEFQHGNGNFVREYSQNSEFQHGNGDYGKEYYQNNEFQHGNGDFGRENYQNNEVQHGDGVVIQIESSQVEKLIGTGGCKIKELEANSGARINIVVTLEGPVEAQQRAKSLIDELMYDNGECAGASGGGGGRQYRNQQSTVMYDDGECAAGGDGGRQYRNQQSSYEQPQQQQHNHQNQNRRNQNLQENLTKEESPRTEEIEEIGLQKANGHHLKLPTGTWASFFPMVKEFYKEHPDVKHMSTEQAARIRKENNGIMCYRIIDNRVKETHNGKRFIVRNPVERFEQAFGNYPGILKEIYRNGFEKPTPIQCQAWPILLSGQDLIGIAQTGTGKTLAFLLPALIHIDGQPLPRTERRGPTVLVMTPTRQLAQQVGKEIGKYSYRGIRSLCLHGLGGNKKQFANGIDKDVHIVIGTPARLKNFLLVQLLNVTSVTFLVFYEGDQLFNVTFEPHIREILVHVRNDRQTVITCGTWPHDIRRLSQSYMKDPIQVHVSSLDFAPIRTVRHTIQWVNNIEKFPLLYNFLQNKPANDKVIVFFHRKKHVDNLAADLAMNKIVCQTVHGDRKRSHRDEVLNDIKSGAVKILLTTDVIRGMDIDDMTYVINYDFPRRIEEYIQRIGRTRHAGRMGECISFMSPQDWPHAKEFIDLLKDVSQPVPLGVYQLSEYYDAMRAMKAQEEEHERPDDGGSYSNSGSSGRDR